MKNPFLIIFLLISTLCFSQDASLHHDHPKIGLVLAGGGAKGIAHIGVLRVLEDAGIRPDYITGTSIGSIMGGLYAIGYSVDDLERMAIELDWNYYFNDELKRTDLPIEERHNSDRYQLRLGLEDGQIQLPKGFIQGQKIGLLLSQLTFPAHGIYDFDKFPIPFRCVATDAETGEAVVIKGGSLAKAMRASMSLPSVFEPLELDGRLLVDGGVVQNLPVQEVLDMGADIVIAVDITSPLYEKEELVSILQVMEQMSSYRLAESVEEQRKLADFIINPKIASYGTLDFSKGDSLLLLGQEAAKVVLPDILECIERRDKLTTRNLRIPPVCKVCQVELSGIEGKRQNAIANVMQMRNVKEYSIEVIEKRIKQLFGSQFFVDAYYELIEQEEGYELKIDASQKSGEYIQISANYDSSLKAALLLNSTFRNRGLDGSKFSLDFKLSEHPMLLADYQVYTTSQPNIGIHIGTKLNHFPIDFYDEEGLVEESSAMYHYTLGVDLFSSFNNSSLFSGGIELGRYSQRQSFFDADTEALWVNQQVLKAKFLRDTYDREFFPREGSYFSLAGKRALASKVLYPDEVNGVSNPMKQMVRAQYSKLFPLSKRIGIHWYNDAGIVDFKKRAAANNFLNLFYLGRSIAEQDTYVEFMGLAYMEVPVSKYWLSGLRFRTEIKDNIFASFLFNYGRYEADVYERILDEEAQVIASHSGELMGVGAEIGFVSTLGPGRFTTEYNLKNGSLNFALHLGYRF